MADGGFVPRANLHRLHPGELVVPRRLVDDLRKELKQSKDVSKAFKKELFNLFRRRPAKVSDKEMNRVLAVMQQPPAMRKAAKKGGVKKTVRRPKKAQVPSVE